MGTLSSSLITKLFENCLTGLVEKKAGIISHTGTTQIFPVLAQNM